MIKYLQLPFYFDASRLQEEVSIAGELQWQLHYQKLHYEGDWRGIPLRSVDGRPDNLVISGLENPDYRDTLFLKQCPYLQEVLGTFKCPLKAVRLLKLDAGAVIKEHTDAELYFEKGEIRLHIPVVTHDDVEFYSEGERVFMKEGECWYVNFNLPHNINNNSSIHRVHLVIDAGVNDWMKNIFGAETSLPKKEIEERDPYDDDTKREMIKRFRDMNTPKSHELADALEKELNQA